jgi:hypothetical protein
VTELPPPADVPTFATEFLQPPSSLLADRQFLVSHLSSLLSDGDSEVSSERVSLARAMKLVVSDPDVDWRYLVIESCSSKGFLTWLAKRGWLLHGTRGAMAHACDLPDEVVDEELDSFLAVVDTDSALTRDSLVEIMTIDR